MSANEIHVSDIGTVITATIKDGTTIVDVSGSVVTFVFRKPTGATVTETGTFVTDGTDGQVKYTSEANFFDVRGRWQYQAKVVEGSNQWYSDIHRFTVHKNLV